MGEEVEKKRAYIMPSKRSNWFTPKHVVELVQSFDLIGLDPCWEHGSYVEAMKCFVERDDGLARDWSGYGLVFVNPPYDNLKAWCEKMALEGKQGVEIIALLPSRTDTRAFQSHISSASTLCFWKGRLKFVGARSGAPFPSLVAYWGERYDEFYRVFSPHGVIA